MTDTLLQAARDVIAWHESYRKEHGRIVEIDQLAEAVKNAGWRPMDTAPEDRPILVFDPKQKAVRAVERMTAMEDGSSAWVYARASAWQSELATGVSFVVSEPAYWIPLPATPASETTDRPEPC